MRAIDAKGHNYGDWNTIKEPTCTEKGSREKICANCKDKVTEEIKATGHSWNEKYTVDKEATCTEEGSESIHCRNCNATKNTREIQAKEHNFGDWIEIKSNTGSMCYGLTLTMVRQHI